jgi:hypothetical protein
LGEGTLREVRQVTCGEFYSKDNFENTQKLTKKFEHEKSPLKWNIQAEFIVIIAIRAYQ